MKIFTLCYILLYSLKTNLLLRVNTVRCDLVWIWYLEKYIYKAGYTATTIREEAFSRSTQDSWSFLSVCFFVFFFFILLVQKNVLIESLGIDEKIFILKLIQQTFSHWSNALTIYYIQQGFPRSKINTDQIFRLKTRLHNWEIDHHQDITSYNLSLFHQILQVLTCKRNRLISKISIDSYNVSLLVNLFEFYKI